MYSVLYRDPFGFINSMTSVTATFSFYLEKSLLGALKHSALVLFFQRAYGTKLQKWP